MIFGYCQGRRELDNVLGERKPIVEYFAYWKSPLPFMDLVEYNQYNSINYSHNYFHPAAVSYVTKPSKIEKEKRFVKNGSTFYNICSSQYNTH